MSPQREKAEGVHTRQPPRAVRWLGAGGALVLSCLVLAGCGRGVIHGTVLDVQGEGLPGVVVGVVGGDSQALTNPLGEYRLPYSAAAIELSFMKSGYTLGRLALEAATPRHIRARPVTLWCLPRSPGLYLFENFQYRTMAWAEPKPFSTQEGDIAYGIQRLPDLEVTSFAEPMVVLHEMPSYDVRLCRLRTVQGVPPEAAAWEGGDAVPQEVWGRAEALPVAVSPIDEPKALLLQLRYFEPLEPGVYAVHWGALDGHGKTDPRAFLFEVADAEPPPDSGKPEAGDPAQEESGSADAEKPGSKPEGANESSPGRKTQSDT